MANWEFRYTSSPWNQGNHFLSFSHVSLIHSLKMIVLFLGIVHAVHLASSSRSPCNEELTMRQILPSSCVFCSFEGLKHFPQVQYNSPSGQYLAQDGHSMFVETSPKSNNSIFLKLWMGFLDSSVNVLNSPVFCKSAMTDSVRDCVLTVRTKSCVLFTLP